TGTWILDSLAFLPEEAGDELETLLIRTALLYASTEHLDLVRTSAPVLRRDVYEELDFVDAPAGAGTSPAGTVLLEVGPRHYKAPGGYFAAYTTRHRLCLCSQSGCPASEYGATRRSYFCPLDMHEGRLPSGFPRPKSS